MSGTFFPDTFFPELFPDSSESNRAGPDSLPMMRHWWKVSLICVLVAGSVVTWHYLSTSPAVTIRAHDGPAYACTFSPDGRILASCGSDGRIVLCDVREACLLRAFSAHDGSVWSVAFSPCGRLLASGGTDNAAKVWDSQTCSLLKSLPHPDDVVGVRFSPDGAIVATISGYGSASKIGVWEVATGEPLSDLAKEKCREWFCILSPNRSRMASFSVVGPDQNALRLLEYPTRKLLHRLVGHQHQVNCAAFSPDGSLLVSGGGFTDHPSVITGDAPRVCLWDTQTGELLAVLREQDEAISYVAFSPDGNIFASASYDGTLVLWRVGGLLR